MNLLYNTEEFYMPTSVTENPLSTILSRVKGVFFPLRNKLGQSITQSIIDTKDKPELQKKYINLQESLEKINRSYNELIKQSISVDQIDSLIIEYNKVIDIGRVVNPDQIYQYRDRSHFEAIAIASAKSEPTICGFTTPPENTAPLAFCNMSSACMNSSSIQAANEYENYLRLGMKALVLFAETNIENALFKSNGNPHYIEKINKYAYAVYKPFKNGEMKTVVNIFGKAPENGGTKNLYSIQTPSGAQCLVGIRVMGESINYCCYPMAELDLKSESWKKYQANFVNTIYSYGTDFTVSITGVHLTIPTKFKEVIISALPRNARYGTQIVRNGSHISYEFKYTPTKKLDFRIQFRPRTEVSESSGSFEPTARCGKPIAVPIQLEDGELLKEPLDKLVDLLSRERKEQNGFLRKKEVPDQQEHVFLDKMMRSNLFLASQSVFSEILMVGKKLTESGVKLESTDQLVLNAYIEVFEKDKDKANEYVASPVNSPNDGVDELLSPLTPALHPFGFWKKLKRCSVLDPVMDEKLLSPRTPALSPVGFWEDLSRWSLLPDPAMDDEEPLSPLTPACPPP